MATVATVTLLAVGGTASAHTNHDQISLIMNPDHINTYSYVEVCGTNQYDVGFCIDFPHRGDSSYFMEGWWWKGRIDIKARHFNGTVETKSVEVPKQDTGDWVWLNWWLLPANA